MGDSWTDWTANLNPYAKSIVVQADESGNDIVYLFASVSTIKMSMLH